jgi:hypothetical protein
MTSPKKLLAVSCGLTAIALLLLSCDNSFFLRGTLNGDCDPPRTIMTDGGADTATIRRGNCQPAGAICCRKSAAAGRTSCQYPEDCYRAPYMGTCATAVDCGDTQTCSAGKTEPGTCQCTLGGPACENPVTHVFVCCLAGQICSMGMCAMAPDGGT